MAELADALDSGSSRGNSVEVQVLLPAPIAKGSRTATPFCYWYESRVGRKPTAIFGFACKTMAPSHRENGKAPYIKSITVINLRTARVVSSSPLARTMKKALARASAFFSEIRSCGTSEMLLRSVKLPAAVKYAYGVWGNEFYFTSTEGRYFTIHEVNYFTFGGAEYFTGYGCISVL